jgi:hypothetical protein
MHTLVEPAKPMMSKFGSSADNDDDKQRRRLTQAAHCRPLPQFQTHPGKKKSGAKAKGNGYGDINYYYCYKFTPSYPRFEERPFIF